MAGKFTSLIQAPLKALHRMHAVTLTYSGQTFSGSIVFAAAEKASHRMRDDARGAKINVLKEEEIAGLRRVGAVFTDAAGNSYTVQHWETSSADPVVHFHCKARQKLPVIADPLTVIDGARL